MVTMVRERIIDAATAVLIREGLDRWTVEAVAKEAGCAKGLVHYHHGSKDKLLRAVAQQLARRRLEERSQALARPGASGLDALWDVLTRTAASGATAAWASLQAYLSRVDMDLGASEDDVETFADQVARSLTLDTVPRPEARALFTALDGLELALLGRADTDAVHEAYHTIWLWLLRT